MTDLRFPAAWRRGVYEAIAGRRDIRAFRPDPIAPEVLARILSAAHHAGSVGFSQPWSFVVVEDRATREAVHAHVQAERLRAAEAFDDARRAAYLGFKLEGILDAPLNICVTCDPDRAGPAVIGRHTMPETSAYSTCGAIQNLWLAARAEGIGVGWVSILEPQALRAILGIPARVAPIAYLCLGHVDSFPDRPTLETAGWLPRLPLGELVFGDAWGQPAAPALAAAIAHEVAPRPEPAAPPAGRGLLLVYTGQGKGKTTAALGLVFRAMGRGLPVAVVQFIKGKWKTGERMFAETLPELTFLVMGQGFTWDSDDLSRDRNAAIAAWERSKQLIAAGDHSLVVLDELTYAINYGFLDGAEVIAALAKRPSHVHVVITGRQAPEALCAAADLVTEMTSPKHPFQQGHKAALGIDY